MPVDRVPTVENDRTASPTPVAPAGPGPVVAGGNAAVARAMQQPAEAGAVPAEVVGELMPGGNNALGRFLDGSPGVNGGAAPASGVSVAFVRAEQLGLYEKPDRSSRSVATLGFGERLHLLDGSPDPTWRIAVAAGSTFTAGSGPT